MVIHPNKYLLLKEAVGMAEQKGLLIYDIMTERFEISTILQSELSGIPEVFGELEKGTPEYPAIAKESVHHFYKEVAGKPLQRPPWSFDIRQQGSGIVDVSNHLVDLILWECFPEQAIYQEEVEVLQARQWATEITPGQFEKATGLSDYPDYLKQYLGEDSQLKVYSNGEFVFTVRGIYGKVSVIWDFEALEGTKDTHFSIMRGSRANLVIRQGPEEQFTPTLYVEPIGGNISIEYETGLEEVIRQMAGKYPGLSMKSTPAGWEIVIPEKYRVGHEAHFSQVTEKFLQYMKDGQLPEWEKVNMLTRYFIIMEAYRKSLEYVDNSA
jgi:predicted dehydrogenase